MLTLGTGEAVGIAGFLLGLVGVIARLAYRIGGVMKRLTALEECKERVESQDLLTHGEHEEQQHECRREIYKDMMKLENRFEKLEGRLEEFNRRREADRKEDIEWKIKITENITEIKTILLNGNLRRSTD